MDIKDSKGTIHGSPFEPFMSITDFLEHMELKIEKYGMVLRFSDCQYQTLGF
jgi:hypothetical protein